MTEYYKFFSETTQTLRASEIRELLKWISKKKIISFGGGVPDPKSYPISELSKISVEVFERYGHKALQYGPTEGVEDLRSEIVNFSSRYGIKCRSIDNVIVTTGSQQSLDLTGRIFIDPGDVILVELPTYLAAINAFRTWSPLMVGVKMDDKGMDTSDLEDKVKALKREGKKVKFVYTIPTCQNPAGLSMSYDRRKHLLEIASKYDLLVVEDDPYSYYVYEDVDVTKLKAMDDEGRVIYMSTFSKILSPGFRIGWIIAEEDAIDKYVLAKQAADLCPPVLPQYITLEALRRKLILKVIEEWKPKYREKRDAMLEALAKYMPEGTTWTRPVGGFFVLVTFPEGIDSKRLLEKALDRGVAFVPGKSFFVDGSGGNTARLNFSYPSLEEIEEGVKILGEVVSEELKLK